MNTSKPQFKIIIGLGNPDKTYENTYHNVGHLFIDYLNAKRLALNAMQIKSNVYMNESGKFVTKKLKKAGLKPAELLVVHDDSDLYLGNYKLSFGRGAAGHHGIENIMAALKTKNFWRLRIGIRPPKEKIRQKSEKFVLKKITAANKKRLETVFQETIKSIT